MRLALYDQLRQCSHIGGAHTLVDIEAIGLHAHGYDLGTKLTENTGGNVVSGAMGAIHRNTQTP